MPRPRLTPMFLTAVLLAAFLPVHSSQASTYPCTGYGRAGQQSKNITVARGVSGILRTPPSADWVSGASRTNASAADIALLNPGGGFVQLGWYVGGIDGTGGSSYLPYSTRPRLFWGENVPTSVAPSGEQLHAERLLSWNTYYRFTVQRSSTPGRFKLLIQGNQVAQSNWSHDLGIPKFVGEVTALCVKMRGLAAQSTSPQRTLQFLRPDGTWGYWDTTKFKNDIFTSIPAGDIATDSVFGGG